MGKCCVNHTSIIIIKCDLEKSVMCDLVVPSMAVRCEKYDLEKSVMCDLVMPSMAVRCEKCFQHNNNDRYSHFLLPSTSL